MSTIRAPKVRSPPAEALLTVALVAGVTVAVVTLLPFELPSDSLFSLSWGEQVVDGQRPSFDAPIAPTPHPLRDFVAVVAALFTNDASGVFRLLSAVSYAGLCVGALRLGQTLFNWPVGAFAALVAASLGPVLLSEMSGYMDLPAAALITWAAVAEARQPRRGETVHLILLAAGLLRPEAWLLGGVYFLYARRGRSQGDQVRMALLAAASPAIWVTIDAVVTGDPLWSFAHTSDLTADLNRESGIAPAFRLSYEFLSTAAGKPVAFAAVGGLVAGGLFVGRQSAIPAAILAVSVSGFIAMGPLGLTLQTRYLLPALTGFVIFCAVGVLGWSVRENAIPHGPRRAWQAAGMTLLLVIPIHFAARSWHDLSAVAERVEARTDVRSDLVAIVRDPSVMQAAERCGQRFSAQNVQLAVAVAYWMDRDPEGVRIQANPPAQGGLFLAPASDEVAYLTRGFDLRGFQEEASRPTIPAEYRRVAANESWAVFANCP